MPYPGPPRLMTLAQRMQLQIRRMLVLRARHAGHGMISAGMGKGGIILLHAVRLLWYVSNWDVQA